ncbi:MAG: SMC family ATPase [Thermoplasmata archaeon]|nr:SMC family ATPase [Thermoplasmata archaeon]
MQLRKLRLRNIRSYRTADVEFGPGTTLIVGDVGSGKTSLLYGIELALFGFAEVDAPHLVRHDAAEAEVTVGLDGGDGTIEVSRHLRRQSRRARATFEMTAATLRRNGAATQYSATELRQRVIELLGFPDNPSPRAHSDLWRWAVYLPQERMRDVLDQDVGARVEIVRKALGLEQYRVAAENAHDLVAPRLRADADTLEAEAEGLQHHEEDFERLSAEIDVQAASLPGLRHDVEVRRHQREELHGFLTALELRQRAAEIDRTRLEELQRQAATVAGRERDLADRVAKLEPEHASLDEELARLGTAPDEAERHRTALEGLRRRRAERRQSLESSASVVTRAAALRAERAGFASTVRETDRHLAELQEELQRVEGELAGAERAGPSREPPAPTPRTLDEIDRALTEVDARRSSITSEVGQLGGVARDMDELLAAGRCPRCQQTVRPEAFEVHRAEAVAAVGEARARLALVEGEARTCHEERRARERYERAREKWLERDRQRAELRGRRARSRALIDESTSARDRATAQLHNADAQIRAVEPSERDHVLLQKELESLEREVDVEERRGEELQQRLELRHTLDERRTVLVRRGAELRQELATARGELVGFAERRGELVARLPDLASLAEELARTRGERDRAEAAESVAQQAVTRADQQLADRHERRDASVDGRRRRGEITAEAKHRRALAGWLAGPFADALKVVEQRRLGAAQVEFERTLARHFATLVEDPAMVARCGNSFAPAVEIEGEWTPPEALSGGERTALALAFRLALGDVVRNAGRLKLETLLLDEPTDGFSPEQVIRMGELIESLRIPQVILVSHEGALASIADRVLRVRKSAGESILEDGLARRSEPAALAHDVSTAPPRPSPPRRKGRKRPTLDGELPEPPPAA